MELWCCRDDLREVFDDVVGLEFRYTFDTLDETGIEVDGFLVGDRIGTDKRVFGCDGLLVWKNCVSPMCVKLDLESPQKKI